jgi:hypothetical protein
MGDKKKALTALEDKEEEISELKGLIRVLKIVAFEGPKDNIRIIEKLKGALIRERAKVIELEPVCCHNNTIFRYNKLDQATEELVKEGFLL